MKLSEIVANANDNYASFPLEFEDGRVVFLRNALMLTDEERDTLTAEAPEDASEVTQLDLIRNQLRAVADDKELCDEFLADIDQIGVLLQLLTEYRKATQAGEA